MLEQLQNDDAKWKHAKTLRVQYESDSYDYVGARIFEVLLEHQRIKRFYRPSERRWVNVHNDAIRGFGGTYSGPDRRQLHVTR